MDKYLSGLRPDSDTACFTGHRVIPLRNLKAVRQYTASAVRDAYLSGYRTFFCGGARGFDTIAALEVLKLRRMYPDIRLIIVIPCKSQPDRWPERDRELYRYLLEQADQTVILSATYYKGCMHVRNRYMVDRSGLCICYLTEFIGGTWSTVRYALSQGVPVTNVAMYNNQNQIMKENAWNYIYTSHSAGKNVHTVHLSPSLRRRCKKMNILSSCFRKLK